MLISVGILVSFDYEYLFNAIPAIYSEATSITIAIHKENKTWTGESFFIPESFFKKIEALDIADKISFYMYELDFELYTTMECETLARNMLGKAMPPADWFIQIDTDEYFLDFKSFIKELSIIKPRHADANSVTVYGKWITMFKSDAEGTYLINAYEDVPLATNIPVYSLARRNEGNSHVITENFLLHQSWDRSLNEIEQKIRNWGHKNDFDAVSYLNFWKSIGKFNFKYIANFHPISPVLWPSLIFVPSTNIEQLRKFFPSNIKQKSKIATVEIKESVCKKILRQALPPYFFTIYSLLRKNG